MYSVDVAEQLAGWRKSLLAEEDACPYPGPRHQTVDRDGESVLISRDLDVERGMTAVLKRSLVILDGLSGVGKSSLLYNGIVPRLKKEGLGVLIARRWDVPEDARSQSDDAMEDYVASCIKKTMEAPREALPLPPWIPEGMLEKGGCLCKTLDESFPDSAAVLILDQFEELLRHQPAVAERLVKWIIGAGYRHRTRFVISLRSDWLHRLDPLLRGIRPFSMDRVRLGSLVEGLTDVDEERRIITKVLSTPRSKFPGGGKEDASPSAGPEPRDVSDLISERAITKLLTFWEEETPRPGLLDLQATLYSLHFVARERVGGGRDAAGGVRIEVEDVDRIFPTEHHRGPSERPVSPFTKGLERCFQFKIERAARTAQEANLDAYLVAGTREMVKRMAPHLSSGDFKVPVAQGELALRALGRELRVLDEGLREEIKPAEGGSFRAVVNKLVVGLLTDLRADEGRLLLRRDEDIATQVLARHTSGSAPRDLGFVVGARRVTAGPMMSASAVDTLVEEVRRVAFAIDWLNETNIAGVGTDGSVLLVHDGAGRAFTAWESEQPETPDYALHQITAARGERYAWPDHSIGGGDFRVLANLNWRECRISATFRKIVFVNCDFTTSRFDGCTFAGVTFVNCLLDDANLEGCTIEGCAELDEVPRKKKSDPNDQTQVRLAPSFLVEMPPHVAEAFAAYSGVDGGPAGDLFSDTSGKPARPGQPFADFAGDVIARFVTRSAPMSPAKGVPELVPTSGGVAVVGGRLCYLTLNRCKMAPDACTSDDERSAAVRFHHVSGSGLDIVEPLDGRIHIYDGAIRGIAITRDGSEAGSRASLTVNDSVVAHVTVSGGIRGSATFKNTFLLMVLNASPNTEEGFSVRLQDCRWQFLANASVAGPSGKEDSKRRGDAYFRLAGDGSESLFDVPRLDHLARELETMDFREDPARWEEEQRRMRKHGPTE